MNQISLIIAQYKNFYIKIQQSILENKKNGEAIFVPNQEIIELQQEIDQSSELLLSNMQVYLKSEWNRVKYESRGKTYEKETQLFDLEELIRKKESPEYKNNPWKRFCINSKAKSRRIWHSHQVAIIIFIIAIVAFCFSIPTIINDVIALF